MSRPAVYAMTQLECEELLPDDSALTRISSTEGSSAGTGEAMVKNASIAGDEVVVVVVVRRMRRAKSEES